MKKNFNYDHARKNIAYRLEVYTSMKNQIEKDSYLSELRTDVHWSLRLLDKLFDLGLPPEYHIQKSNRTIGEILGKSYYYNCLFIGIHAEMYLPELYSKRDNITNTEKKLFTSDMSLYFALIEIIKELKNETGN